MSNFPNNPDLQLPQAIKVDLATMNTLGFTSTIEPSLIPGLAELSEALYPDTDAPSTAIRLALNLAISRASSNLLGLFPRSVQQDVVKGLIRLFGLHDGLSLRVTDRYNLAAPFLLGPQKTYENLRHAESKGLRKVDLVLDEVANELVRMSDEMSFVYTRLFFPPTDDRLAVDSGRDEQWRRKPSGQRTVNRRVICEILDEAREHDQRWITQIDKTWLADEAVTLHRLRATIREELRLLANHGISGLPYSGFLPTLTRHKYVPTGVRQFIYGPADRLKIYLRNNAQELGNNEFFAQGVVELMALGYTSSRGRAERLSEAAWYFGYETGRSMLDTDVESQVIEAMANKVARGDYRYSTVREEFIYWSETVISEQA